MSTSSPASRTVRSRWSIALIATALLLPGFGCSEPVHGDRVPLVGTVTANGEPLDVNATIYFEPAEGVNAIGSAGGVSDSKFSIPAESGPTPGHTYNVTLITSPGIPPEGTPRDQMKVSERFETTVEIPARGADNPELTINFE